MQGKWIDPVQLRTFLETVENRTLKQAAKKLGVSPSAVTQSIQTLEMRLSVKLFERETRPLMLTPAGRRLYARGRTFLSKAESLFNEIRFFVPYSSSLKVGVGESATHTIGPWLIGRLNEEVSEIDVRSALTKPLTDQFRHGNLDIIISPDPLMDRLDARRYLIAEEQYVLIVKKEKNAFFEWKNILKNKKDRPFVVYNEESSDRTDMYRLLNMLDIAPKRTFTVSSSYMLAGLVSELDGWSVITLSDLISAGRFVEKICAISLGNRTITRELWLVSNRGVNLRIVKQIMSITKDLIDNHLKNEVRKTYGSLVSCIKTYKLPCFETLD